MSDIHCTKLMNSYLFQEYMFECLQTESMMVLALRLVEEPVKAVVGALTVQGHTAPQCVYLLQIQTYSIQGKTCQFLWCNFFFCENFLPLKNSSFFTFISIKVMQKIVIFFIMPIYRPIIAQN